MFDSARVLRRRQRNSLDAFHDNFKSCTLFRSPNHFQLSFAFMSKLPGTCLPAELSHLNVFNLHHHRKLFKWYAEVWVTACFYWFLCYFPPAATKTSFFFWFCIRKEATKCLEKHSSGEVKRFSSKAFHFDSVVAALFSVFAPLTISPKSHQSPCSVTVATAGGSLLESCGDATCPLSSCVFPHTNWHQSNWLQRDSVSWWHIENRD